MKILVGYDGSGMAKEAVSLAKAMARKIDGELVIATSILIEENGVQFMEEVEKAEKELRQIETALLSERFTCTIAVLRRGMSPGEDLVSYAGEIAADLIIVGIKRKSRLEKLFMGSNAQYIILNAPCPVLTNRKNLAGWQ